MTRNDWLWHVFAWTIGAVCLWVDVRLFAIYAFASVSIVSRQIDDARRQVDHLRCLVRVLNVSTESKLIAMYQPLGIAASDVTDACHRELARLTPEQIQNLESDYARVSRPLEIR